MPQLVVPSSESQYGYVVGQVIRRVADTIDNDDKPDIIPATGSVSFTPKRGLGRTTNYSAFLLDETIVCPLDEMGRLIRRREGQTEELEPGVFLAAGEYAVSFNVVGSIPGFDIQVTAAHTVLAPLDLVTAAPYSPPTGAVVQTMLVPAGAAVGQVLSWTDAGLGWVDTSTATDHEHAIGDVTGLQDALDGKQAAGSYADATHDHDGTYAPALGPDDNYVTGAEKAALHSHANKAALDNVSGTNTGDQDLSGYATTASLATVATTGAYADLTDKPTLGTAAATASTDYATAEQGAKADTALQTATGQAINAPTGATYTLVAADAGKVVTLTNAAAITLTVPGDVFTAGQRVDCLVLGAGMVTVVGSSCTVNGTPSLVSRAQYSAFTILFTSTTAAVVVGDLASS